MPLIEVRDLRKTYRSAVAVEHVDLDVHDGEIVGVLGPNGAGKTTTVECMAGLTRPDHGTVRVAGHVPWQHRRAVTRLLGVQLQSSGLQAKLTAREAVAMVAAFHDDPADPGELLERLGLRQVADTRYAHLSGGQQQRLAIATALVGRPRVVLLDELTTGLDPEARRDTWQLVREVRDGGTTVVLVTHLMEEAQQLCDRIAVMAAGRVVAEGTPEQVVARSANSTLMSFTAPADVLPAAALSGLPGVGGIERRGDRLEVVGTDDGVLAVLHALQTRGVEPVGLRVSATTLDDAYLDLVRRPDVAPALPRRDAATTLQESA
ncbi:ABC transporter ATP-binding protein [Modestobacter sp. VKM Ac-2979]|uniref:ABC transporter ATP-binding protein n=1 Tax=unclassified Modestobacter TaxID=2643866 RepID=UPI0022AB604B|nr:MULTISPECIES: ABC transporter ATP-binding protein [unclassified Modestobacter]MCZ2811699.1 ABC transporter ATP-binding protein [Modestobacter sp. VKM Ac-2979]MCZ2843422.1 ABC transporter ATP-binding protein [Modestobacter sp. VKM Ac-2980]